MSASHSFSETHLQDDCKGSRYGSDGISGDDDDTRDIDDDDKDKDDDKDDDDDNQDNDNDDNVGDKEEDDDNDGLLVPVDLSFGDASDFATENESGSAAITTRISSAASLTARSEASRAQYPPRPQIIALPLPLGP